MNEHQPRGRGSEDAGTGGTSAAPPWWRSWAVLAPALALVLGLVIGALVAGAGESVRSPGSSPTATVTETVGSSPEDTSIVIPQECLDAAETVEEATDVLRRGVAAVRDFRRQELVDLLNELEDLEARARQEASTCSDVDVNSPTESTE